MVGSFDRVEHDLRSKRSDRDEGIMRHDLDQYIQTEKKYLSESLHRLSQEWPHALRELSHSIIRRAGFREDVDARKGWLSQFDTLTLLYPSLQSDALASSDTELLRQCNTLHSLYLVHSVLEDRILDSQVDDTPSFHIYDKLILLHAEHLYHSLAPKECEWWAGLHHLYLRSQMAQVSGHVDSNSNWELRLSQIEADAAGRAALGFLATSAMLSSLGVRKDRVEMVFDAFNQIATALQWCDDFEDWRDDVRTSRPNLMIERMRFVYGEIDALSEEILRGMLIRSGVAGYALDRARELLHRARQIHLLLDGRMMAEVLEHKTRDVSRRLEGYFEHVRRAMLRGLAELFQEDELQGREVRLG